MSDQKMIPGDNSLRSAENIDDLPKVLLTEILCRLPCNKLIFQCKLVSKPWCNLISAPYFVRRYLYLQRQMQKPKLLTTLFLFDFQRPTSLLTTSDHPVFKTTAGGISKFTLNFLPCYSQAKDIEELAKGYNYVITDKWLEPDCIVPPVVVGTYNDLVLCCATKIYQRHYYLCNPYTKQWVLLPPTPQVYHTTHVAFVCDPYITGGGEEEMSTSSTIITRTSYFILNAEYLWKVVRVVPNSSDPNFHFEIFSSETHQWREIYVECCSEIFSSRPFSSFKSLSSVTYNRMLYWWCNIDVDGFALELDLSKPNNVTYRFIEAPEDFCPPNACTLGLLGVSGGCLQLCMHHDWLDPNDLEPLQPFRIRELKQVVNNTQDNLKWLSVTVDFKDIEVPIPNTTEVLSFLPNNEDVVYVHIYRTIYTCNLRGETVEKTAETQVKGQNLDFYYPFSLPWWPTPVPKSLSL